MTLEDVTAWHPAIYRPKGAVILTAGDLTADEVRKRLDGALGDWKEPKKVKRLPGPKYPAPAAGGTPVARQIAETGSEAHDSFLAESFERRARAQAHAAADAFAAFEEAGIFDRDTAERFRREILEVGGSRDIMDAYVAFRGRKPTIDALLRQHGIRNA